jgi:uncharacterized membrane protein YphA (DoxX/SURF4 family)
MIQERKPLVRPWAFALIRIVLGALFVAAALPKITDPPSFAHMIYNYQLLPDFLLNAMALVLPWLELLCGLALVLGIWKQTAAGIVLAMLFVFVAALGINVLRDNAVNCGCFDLHSLTRSHVDLINDMKLDILRDAGMIAMAFSVLLDRHLNAEAQIMRKA